MIYLNNAATTYPKPQRVLEAYAAGLNNPPSSQFRSAGSFDEKNVFTICRNNLGELFGIQEAERIFFSSGATDSLNKVIGGMNFKGKQIITTQTEHNSVLRTLFNHKDLKESIIMIPCDDNGKIELEVLKNKMSADIGAVIVNHCSNVTGAVQDIRQIGMLTKEVGVPLIVDASQSAGCIPIEADLWNVDVLVFTGHKSLFGPQGTGGHYIRKGVDIIPICFGGTGRDSSQLTYEHGDYEFEVGTQNEPGIYALNAGVSYILEKGLWEIGQQESILMGLLYQELEQMKHVTVYGNSHDNRGPVLSFNIAGLHASDVAYILWNGYDITVRAGLHCAPLIHDALGTHAFGTVRVSISDMTTKKEIEKFIEAVAKINAAV